MLRTLTLSILLGMSTSVISAEHETKSGVNDEDYGRTLPFFGDRVRDMGIKLPKPIGISLFTTSRKILCSWGISRLMVNQ